MGSWRLPAVNTPDSGSILCWQRHCNHRSVVCIVSVCIFEESGGRSTKDSLRLLSRAVVNGMLFSGGVVLRSVTRLENDIDLVGI